MKHKKLLKRLSILLCGVLLVASLTACSSRQEEEKRQKQATEEVVPDEPEEIATEEEEEVAEETEKDLPSDGTFDSIQDMLDSSMMKSQLESMLASLEDSGMSCTLSADEDSLIYDFTITDEALAEQMTKEILDPSLESMASTFESIAGALPSMVEGLDNPSIIVRYLNPDGEEITSMEFFATDAE